MSRAYGAQYASTQNLDIAEIAKHVRADLRQAQRTGKLPAGLTFRVNIDRYSMGQSLDATICGLTDADLYEAVTDGDPYERRRLTATAAAVKEIVRAIVWAYNFDGSDSQTDYYDVRFSGSVSFEDDRDRQFRAREKAHRAALKVVKDWRARGGRLGTAGMSDEVYLDGAAIGRVSYTVVKTPSGGRLRGCWGRVGTEQALFVDDRQQAIAWVITTAGHAA